MEFWNKNKDFPSGTMYLLDYPKIISCDNYATLNIFSILTGLIAIKPNNMLAVEQL